MADPVNIDTISRNAIKLYETNQTTANLATLPLATSLTELSGDGYLKKSTGSSAGKFVLNQVAITFFGQGTDGQAFDWRISGVEVIADSVRQWIRSPIASGTATLGSMVGIAGGILAVADKFCDQVTISNNTSVLAVPTTDITNGCTKIVFDAFHFQDIYVEVAQGGDSNPTNMNAYASSF